MSKPIWDIFCRVVDNYGDVAVCLRLAQRLQRREINSRLWVDDWAPLYSLMPAWFAGRDINLHHLAPEKDKALSFYRWRDTAEDALDFAKQYRALPKPTAVIEAFACNLPTCVIERMTEWAKAGEAVAWINLEYLAMEAWADDCHGLASAMPPLTKRFFFPGFSQKVGGVMHDEFPRHREVFAIEKQGNSSSKHSNSLAQIVERVSAGKVAQKAHATKDDININRQGLNTTYPVLNVSLFCYDVPSLAPAFAALMNYWQMGEDAVALWVPPGLPRQFLAHCGCDTAIFNATVPTTIGALTLIPMPFLSQKDYAQFLQYMDVNFVRGEDSFVLAHFSGKPFVWQAYPQADNAHHDKVAGWLGQVKAQTKVPLGLAHLVEAWNGMPHHATPIKKGTEKDLALIKAWKAFMHDEIDIRRALQDFVHILKTRPPMEEQLIRMVAAAAEVVPLALS